MTRKRLNTQSILCLLAIIIGEVIFFRNIIFTNSIIGDGTDGLLNILFSEHWYQVFLGKEKWSELPFFYPADNVLSYSDMMLGMGIPYSLLRAFNLSMYNASNIVYIGIHIFGSFTMYYFARRCLRFKETVSLIVVWLFSFSNSYNVLTFNPQMFTVSILPFLFLLCFRFYEYLDNKKKYVYGIIAALVLSLIFYTAFYVGYLLILAVMLCVVTYLIIEGIYYLVYKKSFGTHKIIKHIKDLIIVFACFLFFMTPFVWLYLPALREVGGRTWHEVQALIPTLGEILNLDDYIIIGLDANLYNKRLGINIIELVILIPLFVYQLFFLKNNKKKKIQLVLFMCFLVCFAFSFQFHGYSLWKIIWRIVPGASAIRAQGRFFFMTFILYTLLMGYLLNEINNSKALINNAVYLLVFVVVTVTNFSPIGTSTNWNKDEINNVMEYVAQPPKDCDVFFVTCDQNKLKIIEPRMEIYACAIAEKYGIKTINGYTGKNPSGWKLNAIESDYYEKVDDWCNSKEIDHIYRYDYSDNSWTLY